VRIIIHLYNIIAEYNQVILNRACDFTTTVIKKIEIHWRAVHSKHAHIERWDESKRLYGMRDPIIKSQDPNNEVPYLKKCFWDDKIFHSKSQYLEHMEMNHSPQRRLFASREEEMSQYGVASTAFRGSYVTYMRSYEAGELSSVLEIFKDDDAAVTCLQYELARKDRITFAVIIAAEMVHTNVEGYTARIQCTFRSKREGVFLNEIGDMAVKLEEHKTKIYIDVDNFEENQGSGWMLGHISNVYIEVCKYRKLYEGRGGATNLHKLTKRVMELFPNGTIYNAVSVKNDDDCFYAAVAMHFLKNETRKPTKQQVSKYIKNNMKCTIGKPAKMQRINKFERDNQSLDLNINIIFLEGSSMAVYPIHSSKKIKAKNTINLLMVQYIKNKKMMSHYYYINNFESILRTIKIRSKQRKNKDAKIDMLHTNEWRRNVGCVYCFQTFGTLPALHAHQERCGENDVQKVRVPDANEIIKFKSVNKKFLSPIIAVADFECKMSPSSRNDTLGQSFINEQLPVSYSLLLLDYDGKIIFNRTEGHETDIMDLFFDALEDADQIITERLKTIVKMEINSVEARKLRKDAKVCHICNEDFDDSLPDEEEELRLLEEENTVFNFEDYILADYPDDEIDMNVSDLDDDDEINLDSEIAQQNNQHQAVQKKNRKLTREEKQVKCVDHSHWDGKVIDSFIYIII
jgi:hypothetical protein